MKRKPTIILAVILSILSSYSPAESVLFESSQTYEKIIASQPGSEVALEAHKALTLLDITNGNIDNARAKMGRMCEDYSKCSDLSSVIHNVGIWFEATGNIEDAKAAYEKICSSDSRDSKAQLAQVDLAKLNILSSLKTGDVNGVSDAVADYKSKHLGKAGFAQAMYDIAVQCEGNSVFATARDMYACIAKDCGKSYQAQLSNIDFDRVNVILSLKSGDVESIQSSIASFKTKHANKQGYLASIYEMARWSESFGQLHHAKELFEEVVQKYDALPQINQADLEKAVAKVTAGDYSVDDYVDAKTAYQKLARQDITRVSLQWAKASSARVDTSLARVDATAALQSGDVVKAESAVKEFESLANTRENAESIADFKYWLGSVNECDGNFGRARELYATVVSEYSGTKAAKKVEGCVARVNASLARVDAVSALESGDVARAEAAVKEFASFVDASKDSVTISDTYLWLAQINEFNNNFDRAKELYAKVGTEFSGTEAAKKVNGLTQRVDTSLARVDAVSALQSGDVARAEAAVKKFASFADVSKSTEVIADYEYWLGAVYECNGDKNAAKRIYTKVANEYANSKCAKDAKFCLSRIDVMDKIAAKSTFAIVKRDVDKLVAEYSDVPELASTLHGVAGWYETRGWFEEAKNLYNEIIGLYPDSPLAQEAFLDISRAEVPRLITTGNYRSAQDALLEFKKNHANSRSFPKALLNIASWYEGASKHKEAKQVYSDIIRWYPEGYYVSKAEFGIARNNLVTKIKSGDLVGVSKSYQRLLSDYSDRPDFAESLYNIAVWLESKDYFDKASEIYKDVIARYPNTEYSERAKIDIDKVVLLKSVSGSDIVTVVERLNEMVSDLAPDNSAAVMFSVADQYYEDAYKMLKEDDKSNSDEYFEYSIQLFEYIYKHFKDSGVAAQSCDFAGCAYQMLGKEAEAIKCFETLLAEHPDYSNKLYMLTTLGRYYESFSDSSEVNQKIKSVYIQIVSQFPDCQYAGYANSWLNLHTVN